MKKGVNWDDFSFVYRGKHRKAILKLLDKPKTPTKLKEETKLHFNIVSRTLIELENKGFVECLNPNQRQARFYSITKKGEGVLKEL